MRKNKIIAQQKIKQLEEEKKLLAAIPFYHFVFPGIVISLRSYKLQFKISFRIVPLKNQPGSHVVIQDIFNFFLLSTLTKFVKKDKVQLKILFFGIVRDIVGENSIDLNVSADISVVNMQQILKKEYSGLTDIENYAIAVNEEYVSEEYKLTDNDVVAIIPPVSGG